MSHISTNQVKYSQLPAYEEIRNDTSQNFQEANTVKISNECDNELINRCQSIEILIQTISEDFKIIRNCLIARKEKLI